MAEAARNLVCSGARPLAITDCLNFGSPENPDVYYQLKQCVRGLAQGCRALKIPVISGNVSLYNETSGEAVCPTPVVGAVGLLEEIDKRCTLAFKREGDLVFLLGSVEQDMSGGLGGSEYLELVRGMVAGRPFIDLSLERRVQRCCLEAIRRGIVRSAHDCSDGGLAVALAECCLAGGIGFRGGVLKGGRVDAALFGELQSRIVVTISPASVRPLEKIAAKYRLPLRRLGVIGSRRFVIEGCLDLPLEQVEIAWRTGLEEALRG